MVHYEPRLLASKIAKRYADLWLVKYDLEQVHDCCQFLLNQPQDLHLMLAKAVTDSALIRYRRCFNSGVRVKLSDLVETLSTSERELHQLVLDQANNHVAHSANDYEQAVGTVHIAADPDGLRRSGIGAQISMWPPLNTAEIVALQSLTKTLGAGV